MRFTYELNPEFTEAVHQFALIHLTRAMTVGQINEIYEEAKDWCTWAFPENNGKIRFYYSGWIIWISSDDDALEFRLRWC